MLEELKKLHDKATEEHSIAAMRYEDLIVRHPDDIALCDSALMTVELRRMYAKGIFDAMELVANTPV